MSIKDQLLADMKQALKDKDSEKLGVIRLIRSEIKNKEIDEGELDQKGVEAVISRMLKQVKDAMHDFKKGGRDDLVEENEFKIKILKSYLPEQLSDEDLKERIKSVMKENSDLEVGPLIGKVMSEVKGSADGSRVAKMVNTMKK